METKENRCTESPSDPETMIITHLSLGILFGDNNLEQSNRLQEAMPARLGWPLTCWSVMQFVRHCILACEGLLVGQPRLGWNQKSVIDL